MVSVIRDNVSASTVADRPVLDGRKTLWKRDDEKIQQFQGENGTNNNLKNMLTTELNVILVILKAENSQEWKIWRKCAKVRL